MIQLDDPGDGVVLAQRAEGPERPRQERRPGLAKRLDVNGNGQAGAVTANAIEAGWISHAQANFRPRRIPQG